MRRTAAIPARDRRYPVRAELHLTGGPAAAWSCPLYLQIAILKVLVSHEGRATIAALISDLCISLWAGVAKSELRGSTTTTETQDCRPPSRGNYVRNARIPMS